MRKYKCLVLDHDDTVVQTEKTIGYPYFRDYLERIRPGTHLSFPEYVRCCNNMIFADMCREQWQFTETELTEEYLGWKAYSRVNIPEVCPGIDAVIRKQKAMGGLVCVSSLSTQEIIERDFLHHFGFLPDAIYDYDLPVEQRKPASYALTDIMERFALAPEDLLMVDDMKLGCQMAKSVDVSCAFAGWSKAEFPELAEDMHRICDYAFESPAQLYKFLFEEELK